MKSRIGRLEGDARTSKRMHETLGKHVKMLEAALKKEREKVKSLSAGEAVDLTKDLKELAKENLKALSNRMILSLEKALSHSIWITSDEPHRTTKTQFHSS